MFHVSCVAYREQNGKLESISPKKRFVKSSYPIVALVAEIGETGQTILDEIPVPAVRHRLLTVATATDKDDGRAGLIAAPTRLVVAG